MAKKILKGMLIVTIVLSFIEMISVLFQVTVFATFRIPTNSMLPTLQPGDNILVNKSIMGARIFDIWDAAEDKVSRPDFS